MASRAPTIEEKQAIANFQKNVVAPSMSKLVILDFFAEWCEPCKQLTPILEEVAKEYADRGVELVKVDVDKEELIAGLYQIRSMPTVYAIVNGKPVANMTQARTISHVSTMVEKLLDEHKIVASSY